MRRRALLASCGFAAVAASSGCLSLTSAPPPKLGYVVVANYDTAPHRFQVQVLREETVVHDSTHDLAAATEQDSGAVVGSSEVLECTWGAEPGPYVVRARVEGGEWIEQAVAETIEDSSMEGVECVTGKVGYEQPGHSGLRVAIRDNCEDVPNYDGGCAFANRTATLTERA